MLELPGQSREERLCGAPCNEMQDGLVKQEPELPEWRRVSTIEDDVDGRCPELAGEDRKQRGEERRVPGDLDEDVVANHTHRSDLDVGGHPNRSCGAPVADRHLEVGRDPPQSLMVWLSGRRLPEPGEIVERRDHPIDLERPGPAG